jgi:hypothetical protein
MTRSIRAAAVAAVLATAAVTATVVSPQQVASPTFWVENAELDMGKVVGGMTATATFVFHNDGPDDVNIIRAKPS